MLGLYCQSVFTSITLKQTKKNPLLAIHLKVLRATLVAKAFLLYLHDTISIHANKMQCE